MRFWFLRKILILGQRLVKMTRPETDRYAQVAKFNKLRQNLHSTSPNRGSSTYPLVSGVKDISLDYPNAATFWRDAEDKVHAMTVRGYEEWEKLRGLLELESL